MSPKGLSIKLKVALVVCLVSGVSFGVFFLLNYNDTVARIHAHSEQLLKRDHKTHARYVLDTLTTMRQDSETLVGFPPISGIFRTRASVDQTDPLDGSSLEDWRSRLETLFTSVLENRSGYSQIRFILSENNWSEFARVNLVDGALTVVPQSELQEKGNEPYIRALQSATTDELLFSNVTRNRENGQAVGPPTLRSTKRLIDEKGETVGAIVINARIANLLTIPDHPAEIGRTYYAITNHISPAFPLPAEDRSFTILPKGMSKPVDLHALAGLPPERLIELEEGRGAFVSTVEITDAHVPFSFRIATDVDMGALYATARTELWRNLSRALLLTVLASVLGYVFTDRLLTPLQALVKDIKLNTGPRLSPIKSNAKGHDEIALIAQNFTQLTNDLIRETQRLDMVLSNVTEGVITLLEDGVVEDSNPAACRILGRNAPELNGVPLLSLLGFDVEETALILSEAKAAHESGAPVQREINSARADGKPMVLNLSLRHASYIEGNRFVAMIRDVTARAAATEQSAALISALRRSNAELDQFAYVASHDLKAPLRVINNAVSWLEEDLEPYLTDDTRESMNLLQSRASRMERLLNDLLHHSRIGRVAEPDAKVTGEQLAKGIVELLEIPGGITVSFSDAFLGVSVRKLPLETILINLIGNSIKHHDRKEGRIRVDVETGDRFLRFCVEDDGPGIDPIYHERIFEIFQTLKSRDQLESSGMGLAIVKKHIEVAGGEISVTSDGKRGTTFEFLWPVSVPQQDKAA
ncbi:ATP-binding protein [Rhodobacteraceae bacterium G21628-S1]|nr:ATP-binding protein [Rhodobacteraceae bacterium G21628-S1]